MRHAVQLAGDERSSKRLLSSLPCQNSRWARLVADAADRDGGNHAAIDAVCPSEPLLHIYLLGVRIDANVMHGIWQMTQQGDPLTAAMVLFAWWARRLFWFFNCLSVVWQPSRHESASSPADAGKLKEWVMLDIYLVGIGVASIKVQDYAFLQPGIGL